MVKKQYKVNHYMAVESDEEVLFRTREQAEAEQKHWQTLQPEHKFEIEEVEVDRPRDFYLKRYPRIVSHLICESLGYFTPEAAAGALRAYDQNEPFACEWYSHMCSCRGKGLFDEEELLKVGKDVLKGAVSGRKRHEGYMAEYKQAKAIVDAVNNGGKGPELASWF